MKYHGIAIDGPAGSGKSTIAVALAKRLGIVHLDTGSMYRALAQRLLNDGISFDDNEGILNALRHMHFSLAKGVLLLNGEPLPEGLRTPELALAASKISANPTVRKAMQDAQRALSESSPLIMDGRDIGTCVIPDTPFKFYLDADPEERARRRYEQEKNVSSTFEEVLEDLLQRDEQDRNRAVAPLRQAEDAIYIDNTSLSEEQTVEAMLKHIRRRGEEQHAFLL